MEYYKEKNQYIYHIYFILCTQFQFIFYFSISFFHTHKYLWNFFLISFAIEFFCVIIKLSNIVLIPTSMSYLLTSFLKYIFA